jgi:hypothetical protein
MEEASDSGNAADQPFDALKYVLKWSRVVIHITRIAMSPDKPELLCDCPLVLLYLKGNVHTNQIVSLYGGG